MEATCEATGCTFVRTTAAPQHCKATDAENGPCHQTFTGTTSGNMHRVGEHGVTTGPERRRCLTPAEMVERGMKRDDRGYWTTGAELDPAAFQRLHTEVEAGARANAGA
jgi:hypothetical protein